MTDLHYSGPLLVVLPDETEVPATARLRFLLHPPGQAPYGWSGNLEPDSPYTLDRFGLLGQEIGIRLPNGRTGRIFLGEGDQIVGNGPAPFVDDPAA